jgi:hypothetical protein
MAIENIYLYKLKCLTCDAWKEVLKRESDGAPTTCPDNPAHEIDANSISKEITYKYDLSEVLIKQTTLMNPLVAVTAEKGFKVPIAAEDSISDKVFQMPFDVDLISGYVQNKDAQPGDYVEILGMPVGDSPVGQVAAAQTEGNDTVVLDNTGYSNIRRGFFVAFGSNTDEYRIVATDDDTNTITIQPALQNDVSVDDLVKLRRKFVESFYINDGGFYPLHQSVSDAAPFPDTTQMKVLYYHNSPAANDGGCYLWLTFRY